VARSKRKSSFWEVAVAVGIVAWIFLGFKIDSFILSGIIVTAIVVTLIWLTRTPRSHEVENDKSIVPSTSGRQWLLNTDVGEDVSGFRGNAQDDSFEEYYDYDYQKPTSQNGDEFWVAAGNPVEVAGVKISRGMIYVGSGLGDASGYGIEPSLVDPKSADKHYLDWLASDRSDPNYNMAYVFSYFCCLERRLIHDTAKSENARSEIPGLLSEVQRLREAYSSSYLLRSHAHNLIQFVNLVRVDSRMYEQEPTFYDPTEAPDSWEFPIDVRVALAQLVADGRPIPANWALAWYLGSPDTYTRTPAKRCRNEFRRLFLVKYSDRFGEGMIIKPNKTRLKIEYRGANSGLRDASAKLEDLPDVTRLTRPLRRLEELANSCCDELDQYSRWLGRNPDEKDSISAIALLPNELLVDQKSEEMEELFRWLEGQLSKSVHAVVDASDVLHRWPCVKKDRMSKKEAVTLAQFIEKRGYGMEPDVRFGGTPLKDKGKVVLFRLPPGSPVTPTPSYRSATLLMRLSSAVAIADGEVSESEEMHLKSHVEDTLKLNDGERARLSVFFRWLLEEQQGLKGLKKRVEALDEVQRHAIAEFSVGVAGADGRIDPGEIKALKKIYNLLKLDPEQVFSDIHALAGKTPSPAKAPVTIRKAAPSEKGYAIQTPAEEGFILDKDAIRAKLAETAAVSTLLAEIFVDEDSTMKIDGRNAKAPTDDTHKTNDGNIGGLDYAHSVLVRELVKKDIWSRSEYEELANNRGLMPDGAFDAINDASFEACEEPFLEGEDPIEVNPNAKEAMAI